MNGGILILQPRSTDGFFIDWINTIEMAPGVPGRLKIIFYVPNIIGYLRIAILLVSWVKWDEPSTFIPLFILSSGLDFVDGVIARWLGQTSAFGAWLDVVIDNVSRSMIWTRLMPRFGFLFASLEWLTFVCTHQLGKNWKTHAKQPAFVKAVMADNFNTPLGLWVILSIWFLPVWLYALKYCGILLSWQSTVITAILMVGRLLAFIVEGWFILQHARSLLLEQTDN